MKTQFWHVLSLYVALAVLLAACGVNPAPAVDSLVGTFTPTEPSGVPDCVLSPTGRNPYMILESGHQLVLEGKNGKLVITVLDETKHVEGNIARVVEEREWRDGELVEVSRNFFALCDKTKDVYYLGEEVNMYKGGILVSHTGAWLAGVDSAKGGLIMSGKPKVGMKYYQEMAPGVAMDRAEIVSLDQRLKTPAGLFSECIKTKESTALNPSEQEFKIYAPGVGLIQDEDLLLTKHGFLQ